MIFFEIWMCGYVIKLVYVNVLKLANINVIKLVNINVAVLVNSIVLKLANPNHEEYLSNYSNFRFD